MGPDGVEQDHCLKQHLPQRVDSSARTSRCLSLEEAVDSTCLRMQPRVERAPL